MKLIQQLLSPGIYPHPVTKIELVETHISWVILTGDYVYKLKKPVNFGFLDFSTLEKRKHYCNEELRLNKRLAPQIYLDTVAITGTQDTPEINGQGPVLEFAVKMRQFRQQDQFDRLLSAGRLHKDDITALANTIAHFHQSGQSATPDSTFGDPDHVFEPVKENFSQIGPLLELEQDRALLQKIATWSQTEFERCRATIAERKLQGFVRECHGDMHLRNIAKYHDAIVVFDCIEFNDNLRWIDVISEIAFIEMDLRDRDRRDYATILLNTYLQATGDYPAMVLMRYYLVYRAMVRAKVDCLRAHQEDIGAEEHHKTMGEFRHYLDLADRFTRPEKPFLLITSGLSGCGKTYVSDGLMEYLPFVRIRSDVERKRLFGLAPEQASDSAVDTGIYSPQASQKTYARLAKFARTMLGSQWSVLVDAAFLQQEQRQQFCQLASEMGLPFLILHFNAPETVLRERVMQRQQQKHDASEAGREVLESQLRHQQPPISDELAYTLQVDSSGEIPFAQLAKRIQEHLSLI
jgi:aminoglycoside phosphotransferase family enzyme/predicted kinase